MLYYIISYYIISYYIILEVSLPLTGSLPLIGGGNPHFPSEDDGGHSSFPQWVVVPSLIPLEGGNTLQCNMIRYHMM